MILHQPFNQSNTMIKQLKINNFQSHKDSTLEFDPGVNIIVGSSDSGKTAIIRAFRWLITNRPSGDAFRSNWGGDTLVEIIMENAEIGRYKTKSDNSYILEESEFKAMGTNVPDEILDALNLNEINLQQQLDSPFLLSNSPGEVAQHFNKVANLEQIDVGIKRLISWVKELNQEVGNQESNLINLRFDLERFDFLPKLEQAVEALELKDSILTQSRSSLQKLKSHLFQIANTEKEIQDESEILRMESPVDSLLTKIKLRDQAIKDYEDFERLVDTILDLQEEIELGAILISAEPKVDTLLTKIKTIESERSKLSNLRSLLGSIELTQATIINGTTWLEETEKEFHDSMPDICPLCETEIKKNDQS